MSVRKYHPTASSARLSGFPEFWLKVYLQIFVEQAGNGPVLRISRGRCGLEPCSRNKPATPEQGQTHRGKRHRGILMFSTAGSGGRESFRRLVIILSGCCALHFYCGSFLTPIMELFVKSLQIFREFCFLFGVFHLKKFILRFVYFMELIFKIFFLLCGEKITAKR